MTKYIADIAIVVVLVFFAWRGARKGLILTVFGLAALVIAFGGARLISGTFYKQVSGIVQPGIYQALIRAEEKVGIVNDEASASIDSLLEAIRTQKGFAGLSSVLDEVTEKNPIYMGTSRSATEALANYLAQLAAKILLFALSFLAILLLCFLISHALDLAFSLPILSSINTAGGLILGFLKGLIIVVVLVWICQLAGFLPADPTTPVLSLLSPRNLGKLLTELVL